MAEIQTKCILFSRVSTLQQSLESQTDSIKNEALRLGYNENNLILIEQKESAVKLDIEERIGIQQLKHYIENDKNIDCVIVYEISRLARRPKILYEISIYEETDFDYDINSLIKEQLEIENNYVHDCINGIIKNKNEIIKLANKYLNDWTMDRLNKVDQAILLLGIYELMYTETPSIVSINEAIELSKKYSDEAVTKMINGVLDKIYHEEIK